MTGSTVLMLVVGIVCLICQLGDIARSFSDLWE
jgi:hypothetical protein